MSEEQGDTGDPIANNSTTHLFGTLSDQQPEKPVPREQFITTAITFLQNQTVKHKPLQQKQKFLRSKGLTEDEIQIACERAGIFPTDPNSTVINMGISTTPNASGMATQYSLSQTSAVVAQRSTLQYIREILSSTALIAGITYAVYLFYKNYIRPFLFGDKKKKKSIEKTLEEMQETISSDMTKINLDLGRIKEEVYRASCSETMRTDLSSLKSDVETIKGLLLGRKQFSSPVLPPSIPVWQLQSQHTQVDIDKIDDAGSGSGSSETEVVTKNSDSSLELIS